MYKEFYRLIIKGFGHVPTLMCLCIISVLASFIEGFNVGLLVPLLDALAGSDAESGHWISVRMAQIFAYFNIQMELATILIALALMVVTGSSLKYIRQVMVNKIRKDAVIWLRSKYMTDTLNANMAYFHSNRLGAMTDTITNQCNRSAETIGLAAEALFNAMMMLAYVVAAFLISPVLTVGALSVFLLVSGSMHYFVKRADQIGIELVNRDHNFQVSMIETLSGIQVVKAFVLEKIRIDDFKKNATEVGQSQYILANNNAMMTSVQECVVFGIIGAIVYVAVAVLNLGIPVIVVLLFSLYRLMPRFAALNTLRHSLAGSMGSIRTVGLDLKILERDSMKSGKRNFVELKDNISFNSVRFSYDAGPDVLNNTNLSIRKGDMTAVVGASGAGKSTIIGLIQRLYDPTDGYISVDGVDLKDYDLDTWRDSVGVVSQDVFLFNDTILNNISLTNPKMNKGNIVDAAKQAYAHEFIEGLPDGYATVIGDRGWNLSGGQRQRIALARAIIKRPKVLILDEATSSLDSLSEQLIQSYIEKIKGTCTLLVVSHRMATIKGADSIVVLDEGIVVERGDWNTLTLNDGVFAKYQKIQTGELI